MYQRIVRPFPGGPIPDISLNFTPPPHAVKDAVNGFILRNIFTGEISSKEASLVDEVSSQLKKRGFHQDYDCCMILRFSYAHKFELNATVNAYINNRIWRLKHLPIKLNPDDLRVFEDSYIYSIGRDTCQRPVIILSAKRVLSLALSDKHGVARQLIKCLVYKVEDLLNHRMVRGRVDQMTCIINMMKVSVIPSSFNELIHSTFKTLLNNYPCRLNSCLLFCIEKTALRQCKLLVQKLPSITAAKVKIVDKISILPCTLR